MKVAILLTLALAAGMPAWAAPPALPRYGLIVFSSQCVSEQSDDLYGMRVTLRRIGNVEDAIVERADFPTEVVWPVRFEEARGRLSFDVHEEQSSTTTVHGVLSRGGATLTLTGLPAATPGYREVLVRVTDFSRPWPKCGSR